MSRTIYLLIVQLSRVEQDSSIRYKLQKCGMDKFCWVLNFLIRKCVSCDSEKNLIFRHHHPQFHPSSTPLSDFGAFWFKTFCVHFAQQHFIKNPHLSQRKIDQNACKAAKMALWNKILSDFKHFFPSTHTHTVNDDITTKSDEKVTRDSVHMYSCLAV